MSDEEQTTKDFLKEVEEYNKKIKGDSSIDDENVNSNKTKVGNLRQELQDLKKLFEVDTAKKKSLEKSSMIRIKPLKPCKTKHTLKEPRISKQKEDVNIGIGDFVRKVMSVDFTI